MYKEELNETKTNLTAVSQELEVARKQLKEVIFQGLYGSIPFLSNIRNVLRIDKKSHYN